MVDQSSVFNKNTKEWTINFPSGRQIFVSNEFLSNIHSICPMPGESDYKMILQSYNTSTCPGITAWDKEHENDMSARDVTYEELEEMFFNDCDKYDAENVYQDVQENGIQFIHFRDVLPGNYTPNLPNWEQIIADKEAEEELDL